MEIAQRGSEFNPHDMSGSSNPFPYPVELMQHQEFKTKELCEYTQQCSTKTNNAISVIFQVTTEV
jgi:hypothetical protein